MGEQNVGKNMKNVTEPHVFHTSRYRVLVQEPGKNPENVTEPYVFTHQMLPGSWVLLEFIK